MIKIGKLVKKGNLPKNPRTGDEFDLIVKNKKSGKRRVTLKATGKKGFGKWRFTKNTPKLSKERFLISLKKEQQYAEKGWKVSRTKTYLDQPKKAIGKKGYPYAVLNKDKHYETFYTWKEKSSK